MVDFVVDKGLNVLLGQINRMAPNRSKASDGSVGDPDHQERDSDHNPEDSEDADAPGNPDNQVDARDFTHDPARGADMADISENIRISRDRRVKYVIFNRRIFSSYRVGTRAAWTWGPYSGSNPHDKHMHVSVVDSPHDYTALWSIGEDDMPLSPTEHQVQKVINYRVEAILAMRAIVRIPAGDGYPEIVETNQLYVQLKGMEIDPDVLAAEIAEELDDLVVSGGLTEAQVTEVVESVLNRTHLTVEAAA